MLCRLYSGAVVTCSGAVVATVAGVLATVFFAAYLTGLFVVVITAMDAFAGPAFIGAFFVAVFFDAALLITAVGACTVDLLVAAFLASCFEALLVGATVAAFCLRIPAPPLSPTRRPRSTNPVRIRIEDLPRGCWFRSTRQLEEGIVPPFPSVVQLADFRGFAAAGILAQRPAPERKSFTCSSG